MPDTATAALEVRYELTNTFFRFPCVLCGGHTEKEAVIAVLVEPRGDSTAEKRADICPECVAAGPAAVRARVLAQVAQLEEHAEGLRKLAEADIRWPAASFEAIEEATNRAWESDSPDAWASLEEAYAGQLIEHLAGLPQGVVGLT
jgi:hypothetical protein